MKHSTPTAPQSAPAPTGAPSLALADAFMTIALAEKDGGFEFTPDLAVLTFTRDAFTTIAREFPDLHRRFDELFPTPNGATPVQNGFIAAPTTPDFDCALRDTKAALLRLARTTEIREHAAQSGSSPIYAALDALERESYRLRESLADLETLRDLEEVETSEVENEVSA